MHLVSDFDGVWTDPRAEANAIRELMITRLAEATQLPTTRVEAAFITIEGEFETTPFNYGWLFEEHITAFAGEDLYGRNHAVAACLWANTHTLADGELLRAAIAEIAGSADALANSCFKDARQQYRQTHNTFLMPAAAEVVTRLREQGHKLTIVSNSKIAHILDLFEAAKIDLAGIEVIGGARKFHLGVADSVPEFWSWNGGQISLQRPHYLELLERLKPDAVIGDVLSLDLALPLYLRSQRNDWQHFRAGLIKQPYTPAWVISDIAGAAQLGLDILSGFAAVPDWLEQIAK
ncbi:MAG: hypothetical protein AB1489_11335 [Acidobacteriota bacterium]